MCLYRLYKYVERNPGVELKDFYEKAAHLVPITRRWDMPAYTFKLINDGMAYTKDEFNQDGVFLRRTIHPLPQGEIRT
jgi:hypothetical protein